MTWDGSAGETGQCGAGLARSRKWLAFSSPDRFSRNINPLAIKKPGKLHNYQLSWHVLS